MAKSISFLLISLFIPFLSMAQKDTSGYFSSFDGVKIHYEVKGKSKGKPVLLLHGFTGKGSDWKRKPLFDSLIANGFKVILFDQRGNGLSDKPHNSEAYANDAEAKDLMGLMKFLKIKQYQAVGYSRGSIILARLLVLDKHLKKAVIGGMGVDFTNPLWERRIGIYEALISDTATAFADLKKRIVSTPELDRLALAYQQKEQPSTSSAELAKIKRPVLLLCGDQDNDDGSPEDLQKLIPNSKLEKMAGTHNTAWGSIPFALKVVSFLKE